MNQTTAVEVRELKRSFGSREALKGVSFSVDAGEIFSLLGPNGGGKTTLFRILSTLLPPSSGDALVFGKNILGDSTEVRRRIGVVFQQPSLDAKLPAMENLIHHGHLYGMRGAPLRRRAEEMLERLGVADRARDFVGDLSGGLARRVELAKGLLHQPSMLLLDEPSTGLDPAARLGLMKLLTDLRDTENVTVLLTTHYLEEAERSDRVAILDEGRLVTIGDPGKLRSSIGGDVVTLHTDDAPSLGEKIEGRFGHKVFVMNGTVRIEAPDGHGVLKEAVEAFREEISMATFGKPTLEDVFVHLTGRKLHGGELSTSQPEPASTPAAEPRR